MLRNYLRVAVRNLLKNRVFSFINIVGLAVGMAGSLLILYYVANQLSYESMHENRSHIYRVSIEFGSGTSTIKLAGAFPALGPAAATELPDVKASVRFRNDGNAIITANEKEYKESNFFFSDSNVFSVFTFPLMAGNSSTALNDPSSIVISENLARKYFGSTDVIGRRLTYDKKYDFVVSGVMRNVPANTMIRCELIAPYSRALEIQSPPLPWLQWGQDFTYLYLNDAASLENVKSELEKIYLKNTNKLMASMMHFRLIPISDVYFKSDMMGELAPTGNITTVYLLSSVAVLLLLIACLNFINLSTARSLRRSKEVGLRKTFGANRSSLVLQFFGESLFVSMLALLLSLIVYEAVYPVLYDYFGMSVSNSPVLSLNFIIVLFSTMLFVGLVAGIYPALFLSKYKPVESLKGQNTSGSSGAALRKGLVTTQFAVTTILIIGTMAIYRQLNFMRNSNLGFNKENVLVVDYPISDKNAAAKYSVVKEAFLSIPGVIDVSGSYSLPGIANKETQSVQLKGKTGTDFVMFQADGVDYDYVQTLGLELIKGRNFSEKFVSDSTNAIILNETAVRDLDLKDPIGAEVYIPGGNNTQRLAKVIGVIRDFHLSSFHNKIEPMFLYINPARYFNIALKMNAVSVGTILPMLEGRWKTILPGKDFSYSFLDQAYNNLYQSDQKTGSLFSIFASLSIVVACMGLFGLVAYTVEVRTKEIGVRKVLGAGLRNIALLLSKDFLKWVLISNLIAWPLAYYLISKWLEGFAYRTDVGPAVFVFAMVLTLLIAALTISLQAIKAARTDPARSLRYE